MSIWKLLAPSCIAVLLAICVPPTEAVAQDVRIESQNRIRLFGSWRFTIEEQDDNFDMIVRTASGDHLFQFDEDDFEDGLIRPIDFDNDEPSGWIIDFYDDHDEDGAPPGFIEVTMLDADTYRVSMELTHGTPSHPYDDAIVRLDRLSQPSPTGCRRVSTLVGDYYECNGQQITQTSRGLRSFSTYGDIAIWIVDESFPPASSYAWYANSVSGSTATIRQITQRAGGLPGAFDEITSFSVHGDIAVWRFQEDAGPPPGLRPGPSWWFANSIRTGQPITIRQLTQETSDTLAQEVTDFLVVGNTAVWQFSTQIFTPFREDTRFANSIAGGTPNSIRQISHTSNSFLFGYPGRVEAVGPFFVNGDRAVWRISVAIGQIGWYSNCLSTGTDQTITPVTDLVGGANFWDDILFFRVMGNAAFWRYQNRTQGQDASALLPSCAPVAPTIDATLDAGGGTAADTAQESSASVHAPNGVLPAATGVAIDVQPAMSVPPVPGFRSDRRTSFIDITLHPALTAPLPAPGISLTLPLELPLLEGQALALFEVDPESGLLVPKLGVDGRQILGAVDPGGTTGTFHGVISFSLFVGMALNGVPTAVAGPDRAVGCCGFITLDASASSDPDGDVLTSMWSGPFGTVTGPMASVVLPVGTHTIVLTVDDGHGGTATDTLSVTVNPPLPPAGQHSLRGFGAIHLAEESRAKFSLDVAGSGSPSGSLTYADLHLRMAFVSTSISGLMVTGTSASVTGTGSLKGKPGYTFTVSVVDGIPDRFGIEIRAADGSIFYTAPIQALAEGDMTLR